MALPAEYGFVSWYGRGFHETYADRKGGAKIGLYSGSVKELIHNYMRPQENGNRTDVRWASIINNKGHGLMFEDAGGTHLEDFYMIELIAAGIFYLILSLILMYRVAKGPSVVDRAVAGDSIDLLTTVVLIAFAVYSGRSIYLDIALVVAILGFLSTLLISKYLEGKL
jgi:multisubunit Na+/H+ antiporter MnhF subunit